MFFAIAIAVGIIALGAAFFSKVWSWATLILFAMLLFIPLSGLKSRKKDLRSKKLSAAANAVLERYGHYYSMPHAAKDFGRAAVALHLFGTITAVVNLFQGYWSGVAIGVVYFVALGMLARAFDPNNFLYDQAEKAIHEEIAAFLEKSANIGVGKASAKLKK